MVTARPAACSILAILAIAAVPAAARDCPGSPTAYPTAPPADFVMGRPPVEPIPGEFRPVPELPGRDRAPRPTPFIALTPLPLVHRPAPAEHAVLVQVSMHHASFSSPGLTAEGPQPRRLDSATAGVSFAGITAAGAIIGLAIRKLPR